MSDDLLPYFIAEGRELTERASRALSDLSQGVDPREAVEQAFRALHTLKGSTGLFGLDELGALLHAAESDLGTASPRLAELTACVEETERWIEALEAGAAVPPERRRAAAALAARLQGAPPPAPATHTAPADWALALVRASGVANARVAIRYTPDSEAYFRGEDPLAAVRAVPNLLWLDLESPGPDADTPFVCDLTLSALSAAPREAVAAALRLIGDQAEIVALDVARAAPTQSRTVRVDAGQLDAASDLLAQLIVAKNALAYATAQANGVGGAQLALDRTTAALHEAIGRMRLAPLRPLFASLPRQAREMAEALGKTVDLAISGEDVALDKAILDGLYEPLVHVLRNAVDHGVEAPDARLGAGKPARGRICVSAVPRGDTVEIAVEDDGAGLDLARIRTTAAARGLVAAGQILTDGEAADLIFAPGFSTARKLTEISGRGVGLDAVRAAMARLGGRVGVESRPGAGVTVRMTAPLRTLLTRIAIFTVGKEQFGAPLHSIREMVRVRRSEVMEVRAREAIVVREDVTPLFRLAGLVGGEAEAAETFTALIVETGQGPAAIVVDRVDVILQAPVQPAGSLLSGLKGVTGSFLREDGSVVLLLDLAVLAT